MDINLVLQEYRQKYWNCGRIDEIIAFFYDTEDAYDIWAHSVTHVLTHHVTVRKARLHAIACKFTSSEQAFIQAYLS